MTLMSRKEKKVYVAMSGGVDSSVAAMILKNKGFDVTGVFMRCYNLDGCAEKDAEDARRVAQKLNIPFYIFNFEREYKKEVVNYMVEGYKKGITPNPDVMCNKEIKFGLFLKKAHELGADYIATGHYVRLKTNNIKQKTYSLYKAKDENKDQSYFLWTLTQNQLKHCLFPIGDYLKLDVRKIAKKGGLPTAEKKDSQGICFLGKVSLADFLQNYIPEKQGMVVNTEGKKIGEHKGAWFYTVGQRHIGVASKTPIYVAEKNVKKNIIKVAEGNNDSVLYQKGIRLKNANFINPKFKTKNKKRVLVRVRYRQPLVSAILKTKNSKLEIDFDKSVKFVAPGQSAVFYKKNGEMLGGGIIT